MKYAHLIDTWKKLYEEEKKSFREIGIMYGVSKATVSRTLGDLIQKRNRNENDNYAEEWFDLYVSGWSKSDIATKYKVSQGVVARVLKLKGVFPEHQKRKYDDKREEFKLLYESGFNLTEISQKTGVSRQTILNYLNEDNVKIRDYSETSRLYELNEHYFDQIDTPEKAYWFGFIYGNGSLLILPNTHILQIAISKKKKELLYEFNKQISSEREPYYYEQDNTLRIRYHSKHLFDALTNYGLDRERDFPDFLPDDLIKDFLQGYFTIKASYSLTKKPYFYVLGTFSFLSRLKELFHDILNVELSEIKKRESFTSYQITTYKKTTIKKIIDWIEK